MNYINIKNITNKNIEISENELQNQVNIIFESSNSSESDKSITLIGKGSLKFLLKV